MALVIIEGFEGGGTTNGTSGADAILAYLNAKYTTNFGTGDARPQTQPGWGAGRAMAFAGNIDGDINFISFPVGSAVTEVFVGFAVKPESIVRTSEPILRFRDTVGGINNVVMEIFDLNHIQFYRNVTLLPGVSASNVLRPNRWSYVEVRVVFSNTVGVIECRINGVEVINVTGLDTLEGTSTDIDTVRMYGGESTSASNPDNMWLFDDVYIVETNGSDAVSYLGPVKVEAIYPTAEGSIINFTPSTGSDNSALVDEDPRNDDTDYNSSADTPSNKDLLGAGNLSVITGGIIGVSVSNDCKLDAAGSIGIQSIVFENAVQGTGDIEEVSSTSDYITVTHIFENNPDTGVAWSVAQVNAVEIGYEID